MKNIPILNKFNYDKLYIYRAEDLLERMRWEVYWDKQKKKNKEEEEKRENYKFKTSSKAPQAPELKKFEEDVFNLLANIERRSVNDALQDRMKSDLRYIRGLQDTVVVNSDKTSQIRGGRAGEERAGGQRRKKTKGKEQAGL